MKVLLEVLRIVFIMLLLGGLGITVLYQLYNALGVQESLTWMGSLAIWILLFILYRNKLQFTGWYKGVGRERLPKRVSRSLIMLSIVLIVIPLFSLILSGETSIENHVSETEAKQIVAKEHANEGDAFMITSVDLRDNAYYVNWKIKGERKNGWDQVTRNGIVKSSVTQE